MKKAVIVLAFVAVGVALLFFFSLQHATVPTHIHFTARDGALTAVLYTSEKGPQPVPAHDCDRQFTEMPEHLYEVHLERWKQRHAQGPE